MRGETEIATVGTEEKANTMNRRSNYTSIAARALVVLALLAISFSAFAQVPGVGGVPAYAPPFDVVGYIQDAGIPVGEKPPLSACYLEI